MTSSTFFPNIFKLIQILATLPVSTASSERSFSTLRRTKNYLRNATGEDRLTGLALMNVHREIVVDPVKVSNKFFETKRKFK